MYPLTLRPRGTEIDAHFGSLTDSRALGNGSAFRAPVPDAARSRV